MKSLTAVNTKLFAAGSLLLALAVRAETVVISHGGIDVSFEEAFAYSLRHTNPSAYVASMSKPQATFRVLENLYVLKRVAHLVETNELLSGDEREYLLQDQYRRALLERFLEDAIAERMADIDWEGLARAEYAQRKIELRSSEEVRVEHILVSIEGVPFDAFVSRVREVQEALAGPEDFSELVPRYSDDPSVGRNGGDLGFFTRSRMQPTFSEAAFSLVQPGEIAGPVMTRFGAHFLRLIDRRDAETLSFDSVKASLIRELEKSTRVRLREEFLSGFKAEIGMHLAEIDEPALVQEFLAVYEELQSAASVEQVD